jgi:hypothetical protein
MVDFQESDSPSGESMTQRGIQVANRTSNGIWRVGRLVLPIVLVSGMAVATTGAGASIKAHSSLANPTKALCKAGKTYKVGYDVFSSS